MNQAYDVIVIGAGPAGYVAAIRCAQLGLNTVCVDSWLNASGDASPGGTCLNVGCIPSKALLESSHLYQQVKQDFSLHGINTGEVGFELEKMLARKDTVVKELTQGIKTLFDSNKVKFISGRATLTAVNEVSVVETGKTQTQKHKAKNIILATGSNPIEIPSAPFDEKFIVDSTGALAFDEVPRTLGIVGAGVIGLELGSVWKRLGAEVILFEAMDQFLPIADSKLSKEMQKLLKQQGLEIRLGTKVEKCEARNDKVYISYSDKKGSQQAIVDKLVVAVGRRPNSQNLCAQDINLEIDQRGFVVVDDSCRTNLPNVYAIGDLVRGPMLAHKGSEEGVMVAELIAGHHARVNYGNIPSIIYTHPEVAWVGETEQSLKEQGREYNSGVFPFAASGRARASGDTEGMVKILADKQSDRILGVHMIGSHCSELIAQIVIAREFGASSEDLSLTMFAHPTLSEAVHEAALAVDKRAIHMAQSRRNK